MYSKPQMLAGAALALIGFSAPVALAQEEWRSEDGGNIRMEAGDETIRAARRPGTSSTRLKTIAPALAATNSHFDGTITVSIEASFMADGEVGSLDNMVDLAAELIAEEDSYEIKEGHWNTGPCRGSRIDPCSTQEWHTRDQYHQTNQILVRFEDEDGGASAFLHIWVEATRHDADNSGWCDAITTIGSAVSGAIGQGVAGGAFSLASLGCAAF